MTKTPAEPTAMWSMLALEARDAPIVEGDHAGFGQGVKAGPQATLAVGALRPSLRRCGVSGQGQEQPADSGMVASDLFLVPISPPLVLPLGGSARHAVRKVWEHPDLRRLSRTIVQLHPGRRCWSGCFHGHARTAAGLAGE